MIAHMLKSGVRYILSYLVVSVICTVLIVAGNDVIGQYTIADKVSEAILQIGYEQWLPVCAVPLFLTGFLYLLFVKLMPRRLPLFISGLIGGAICLSLILLTGVCTWPGGWYEVKNLSTFFVAGFSFAILVEMLD